jgi:hypothetical protein
MYAITGTPEVLEASTTCHDIDVIVDQHDIGSMFMDGESQM